MVKIEPRVLMVLGKYSPTKSEETPALGWDLMLSSCSQTLETDRS